MNDRPRVPYAGRPTGRPAPRPAGHATPPARRLVAPQRRSLRSTVATVAAVSGAAFVLLWGALTVQMARGHDPVLSSKPSGTDTAASGPDAAASGDAATTGESDDTTGDDGTQSLGDFLPPVTSSAS